MDSSTVTFNPYPSITSPVELFQVFSSWDAKTPMENLVPRPIVHKTGSWHRAVGVFIIHGNKVLLQQRSRNKVIFPSAWDVSVAEHCKPDESWSDACIRGMKEELNLDIETTWLSPLIDTHPMITEHAKLGIKDYEIEQIWKCEIPLSVHPKISFPDGEVEQIIWVDLQKCLSGTDTLKTLISEASNLDLDTVKLTNWLELECIQWAQINSKI